MEAEAHLNEQRCLLADVVDELQLGQRLHGGGKGEEDEEGREEQEDMYEFVR